MSNANNVISEEEVKKVARLARLYVPTQEIATHVESLSNILDLIAQIKVKDTESVIPMSSPLEETSTPLRDDKVTESDQRPLLKKYASLLEDSLFIVPKVIE